MKKVRKRRAMEYKCLICKKKFKTRQYSKGMFLPQKTCKRCEKKYKSLLDEAKVVERNSMVGWNCLVCDTVIRSGNVCIDCFTKVATICTRGYIAKIEKVLELFWTETEKDGIITTEYFKYLKDRIIMEERKNDNTEH